MSVTRRSSDRARSQRVVGVTDPSGAALFLPILHPLPPLPVPETTAEAEVTDAGNLREDDPVGSAEDSDGDSVLLQTQPTGRPTSVSRNANGYFDFSPVTPVHPVIPCISKSCSETFDRVPTLTAHLRRSHRAERLDPVALKKADLVICPHCQGPYRSSGIEVHKAKCSTQLHNHRPPPADPGACQWSS